MIGSVAGSRRATAFAHALDERDSGEATAADQAAGEEACRAVPSPAGGSAHRERSGAADAPSGLTASESAHPDAAGSAAARSADSGAHGGTWADGGTERSLLLAVVDGLAQLPKPELSAQAKTEQRARLVAAMESAVADGTLGEPNSGATQATSDGAEAQVPEQRTAPSWRRRCGERAHGSHRAPDLGPLSALRPKSRLSKGIAAGGLGFGVAASALGGVAAASTNALPGDSLYGVKRGMEDLRLDLASDDADRGKVHLDRASTRLQEARRLMERDRSGTLDHESLAEVRRALSGVRDDAAEGHRLLSAAYERDGSIAPMRSLSSFSDEHRDGWSRLRDRLPTQLSDVRDKVSSVFDAIDSDVGPLKGLLSDGSPKDRTDRGGAGSTGAPEHGGRPSPDAGRSGSPSASAGKHGDGARGSGPSPSEKRSEHGGLIGEGGLLDPPSGASDGGTPSRPSQHGTHGRGRTSPDPDVTLPPIVPEVLPGVDGLSGNGHE